MTTDDATKAVDTTRCPLCDEPNDCALARGDDGPCWCARREFPPALRERARSTDGGASCICRRCLERAAAAESG